MLQVIRGDRDDLLNDSQFETFKQLVRHKLGLDLGGYKPDQMRRRVENFIQYHGGGEPAEFFRLLEQDAALTQKLADHLTINVTEFSRDPLIFERVVQSFISIAKALARPIRIWSAGCSSGAEAYSLCMAFNERAPELRFSILATDFDSSILGVARRGGPYPNSELKQVSAQLMAKYFIADGTGMRFKHAISQRVSFKQHDLLKDRFEAGFDFVVCRNVLIYLTAETRAQVINGFLKSLKPGGLLFLGASEALIAGDSNMYQIKGPCLYERIGDAVSMARRSA